MGSQAARQHPLQRELRMTMLEALRESAFRVIAEYADRHGSGP